MWKVCSVETFSIINKHGGTLQAAILVIFIFMDFCVTTYLSLIFFMYEKRVLPYFTRDWLND